MTLKRSVGLSLALGAVCSGFRLAVWQAAYDPETQLITDSGLVLLSNLFFCLCLLVIGLLFVLRHPRDAAAPAPYSSETPLRRLLRLAAVCCSIASGVLLLWEQGEVSPISYIAVIMGVLLVGQGVAELLLTLWKDTDSKRYASLLLLPAFSGCYWLVAFYHQFGPVPNRETYLWPTITGVVVAAAWLGYIAFAYEKPRGTLFALAGLIALPMLLLASAAPLPLSYRLSLLGQLAWLWAALLTLHFRPVPQAGSLSPQDTEIIEEGESPCLKN